MIHGHILTPKQGNLRAVPLYRMRAITTQARVAVKVYPGKMEVMPQRIQRKMQIIM